MIVYNSSEGSLGTASSSALSPRRAASLTHSASFFKAWKVNKQLTIKNQNKIKKYKQIITVNKISNSSFVAFASPGLPDPDWQTDIKALTAFWVWTFKKNVNIFF